MPNVSNDFLLAALRMVEYLEHDEMRDFETMEANGEPTDRHIYISVNKVRSELLLGFDVSSSDTFEEDLMKNKVANGEAA